MYLQSIKIKKTKHQNGVKINRYKIRHINIFLGKGSFQIKPKAVDRILYLMDQWNFHCQNMNDIMKILKHQLIPFFQIQEN